MKRIFLFIIQIFVSVMLFAQTGKVYDNLTLTSSILNAERKYAIYLPPGYETSERSYPVLYLLHGAGDDQTGWIQLGEVEYITSKCINEGYCTPMIIVMPDANTGQRGYFNSIKGDWQYEDFFFEEFIPFIEKTYRIRSQKRYRAVAGQSMGGGGTYIYALHHPELFSSACPLSAATGYQKPENVSEYIERNKIENVTEEQISKYYTEYSVLNLIKNMPEDQKQAVRWFIDCGDDDFLYEGNSLVHIAMCKNEIPHEYRVRDGRHEWEYWRTALPEVLSFISRQFHK